MGQVVDNPLQSIFALYNLGRNGRREEQQAADQKVEDGKNK